MILPAARLTLRLYRFELFAFGAALLALALAGFAVGTYLDGLRPAPDCFVSMTTGAIMPACQRALEAYDAAEQTWGNLLLAPILVVTYTTGLFLGVPVVARELERGTSRLAWSLAPVRWRWFLARVAPVLALLVVMTFVAGVAADRLFAAAYPTEDLTRSFTGFGARGVLLASRAAFIFGIAVAVGGLIGRSLPAIIVAGIVAYVGLAGGEEVQRRFVLRPEAIAVDVAQPSDLYFDQRLVLPNGDLVGWEYFGDSSAYDENGNPLYPIVSIVLPGERYQAVEQREALVLAGATFAALGLAVVIVNRRRPG
jgi:hypothetical protein